MSDKKLTYEEAMVRLSEIIAKLESGEAALDESMELFEEGARLSAFCHKKLEAAEQKIIEFSSSKDNDGDENE